MLFAPLGITSLIHALVAELAWIGAVAPGIFATFSAGPWALPVYIVSGFCVFWKGLGTVLSPITRKWLQRGPTLGFLRLVKVRHTRLTDKSLEAVNRALSPALPLKVAALRADWISAHVGIISGMRIRACGVRVELVWTDASVWEITKEAIAASERNRPRNEAQAVIRAVQQSLKPKGINGILARFVECLASSAKVSLEGLEVFIAAASPGDAPLLLTSSARAHTSRCAAIEWRGTRLEASMDLSCKVGTHDLLESTTVMLGAELPRIIRTMLVPKPLPNKRVGIDIKLGHSKLALRPSAARTMVGFSGALERFSSWKAGVVARTQEDIVPAGPGEREQYLAALARGEDVSELEARMTRRDILLVYREWQEWPQPEGTTIDEWFEALKQQQKPVRSISASVCLQRVAAEVLCEADSSGQGLTVRVMDTRGSVNLHDMALEAESAERAAQKARESKRAAAKVAQEGSFQQRLSMTSASSRSPEPETPAEATPAPLLDAEFGVGAIEVRCEPDEVFAVPVLEPCTMSAEMAILKSNSKDIMRLRGGLRRTSAAKEAPKSTSKRQWRRRGVDSVDDTANRDPVQATISSRVLWKAQQLADAFAKAVPRQRKEDSEPGHAKAKQVSTSHAARAQQVTRFFAQADTDGSGFLNRGEVHQVVVAMYGKYMIDKELEEASAQLFEQLDEDGSNAVPLSQFLKFFERSVDPSMGAVRLHLGEFMQPVDEDFECLAMFSKWVLCDKPLDPAMSTEVLQLKWLRTVKNWKVAKQTWKEVIASAMQLPVDRWRLQEDDVALDFWNDSGINAARFDEHQNVVRDCSFEVDLLVDGIALCLADSNHSSAQLRVQLEVDRLRLHALADVPAKETASIHDLTGDFWLKASYWNEQWGITEAFLEPWALEVSVLDNSISVCAQRHLVVDVTPSLLHAISVATTSLRVGSDPSAVNVPDQLYQDGHPVVAWIANCTLSDVTVRGCGPEGTFGTLHIARNQFGKPSPFVVEIASRVRRLVNDAKTWTLTLTGGGGSREGSWQLQAPINFSITGRKVYDIGGTSLLVEVGVDARCQAPIITLRGISVVRNLTNAQLTVGDGKAFSVTAGPGETVPGWLGGRLNIYADDEALLTTPPDSQTFKVQEKRLKSDSMGYRFILNQGLGGQQGAFRSRTILCVPKLRLLNTLPGALTCWAWNRLPGLYQEPEVLIGDPQTLLDRWGRLSLRSVEPGQPQSLDGVDPVKSILIAFQVSRKRYLVMIPASITNTKRSTLRARSSLRNKGLLNNFDAETVQLISLDADAPVLDVDLEWENHGATVVVYSQYWVANKTGRQLQASSEDYMRNREAVTTAAVDGDSWAEFAVSAGGPSWRPQLGLLHGFNDKVKFKIVGGLTGSEWAWDKAREKAALARWPDSNDSGNCTQLSQAISVGVSNATGVVELEGINAEDTSEHVGFGLSMTVGVSIRDLPTPFERSKLISVTPRYVVMNNLERDLQVWPTIGALGRSRRAPGGVAVDGLPSLKAGGRLALDGLLHLDFRTKFEETEPLISICFFVDEEDNPGGRSRWSNQISMQSVGDSVISVDSGLDSQPPMAVRASVQLVGATMFVVLSEGQYPFCIENRSVVHTVVFSQEGAGDYAQEWTVRPCEFRRFVFPDPDQPKTLLGRIRGATDRLVSTYDLDNLAETRKDPLCTPSTHSRARGVPQLEATFTALGFARTLRLEDIPLQARGSRFQHAESGAGAMPVEASSTPMPRSLVPIGFRLSLAGVHVCVVDTHESSPQELLAFTVDYISLSKPPYRREMEFTVHHAQLDDFSLDDRFIFGPVESGLNSLRNALADAAGFEAKSWLSVKVVGPQDGRIAVFDPVHSVLSLKSAEVLLRPMELHVDVPRLVNIAERLATWVSGTRSSTVAADRGGTTVLRRELAPGFRTPVQGQDMTCIISTLYVGYCMISAEVRLRSRQGDLDDDEETLDSKLRRFMAGLWPPLRMFLSSFVHYGSSVAEVAPRFKFQELLLRHVCSARSPMVASLAKHYQNQILSQTVRVIGSVQVLGDPANLFEEIGGGFAKFLKQTGERGAIGEGIKDLSGSIVGGACGSVAKISGALKDTIGSVAGMPVGSDRRAHNLSEGIDQALTSLATGVSEAVNGLVELPVVRAHEEGWKGFVQGTSVGVVGVLTRPAEGILGSIEKLAQGVEGQVSRDFRGYFGLRRPPRMDFSDMSAAAARSGKHAALPPMSQSLFWPLWRMLVRRVSFPALWWDRRVRGLVISLAQAHDEGLPHSEVFIVRGWEPDSWALQEDMVENSAIGRVGHLRGPFRLQVTALLEPNVEMTKAVKVIAGFGTLPNIELTSSLVRTPMDDEELGHVFQVLAVPSSLLGGDFPIDEGQHLGRVEVCVMGQTDKKVMAKNFSPSGVETNFFQDYVSTASG